jgi:tRNA (cytidine32/uridine32-2'-O)-methyltransferase
MNDHQERLRNIRIVLVRPTHPGNIGAVARAMKTMCLDALYLVEPVEYLGTQVRARAAGADDILLRARRCESLPEALRDCRLVIGTSARTRAIPWPSLAPESCAQRLVLEAGHGPVALVFGREKMGLTNAELDLCQYMVGIPANPRYASLNLACAVQILGYELLRASPQYAAPSANEWHEPQVPLARAQDLERFYCHLQELLVETGFLDPAKPRRLMRRLYRLFNRACLDENEVNILRGILTAVQQRLRR